ncbi:zinc finger protein 780A-like [Culicoides brevitarsis]|uniref:zinc finger protein 780A-like n=1 Tax=Culicoides brevitarsis TaxID=469753 RepID=UPI00307C2D35
MSLFQNLADFPELLPVNRNFYTETSRTAEESTLPQRVFCCPVCRSRFLHLTSFIVCCANHLPFPIDLNGPTDELERDFTLLDVKPETSEGYEALYTQQRSTKICRESSEETEFLVKKLKIIVEKLYLPGILKNDWIYVPKRMKKDISWISEDQIKTESISSNNNNDFDDKFSEIDCPKVETTDTKEANSYFIKQEEIPNIPQFQGSKYIFGVYSERRYKKIKESKKNGKISRRKVKKEELTEEEDESQNFLRPKKNYYKDEAKTCKICGKTRTKSNIRRHVAGHCAEEDDLDCKICFATQTAPNKLREHYSRVHQVKFREYLYNMQKEKMQNGSISTDSVTCTVCYTNMKSESDLKYHYEMLHSYKEGGGKSKGTLECNICGKTFAAVQNRNLHIRRIHKQIPDGSVFCHYCGKDFVTKGFLLSHFRNLHFDEKGEFKNSGGQTTKKRYKHPPKQANTEEIAKHYMHYKVHSICEICGLIKESRFALMRHRYEKHGVVDSGYSKIIDRDREENDCSVCGKHFTSLRKWKDHEKYHQKEQANLFCQVCGAKCKTITYLKSHMLRHGEKQFVCDFEGCGKSFA